MAVLSVGNPASLYMNALGFLANANLGMLEEPLADAMLELLDTDGDEGKRVLLDAIDPNRRIVLAVYPGNDAGTIPLLFLPLRATISAPERRLAETAIAETMSSEGESVWVDDSYPGYLVARPGLEEIPAYGATATMDLRRLAAYPDASVALWLDPKAGSDYIDRLPGLGALIGAADSSDGSDLEYWSSEPSEPVDNLPAPEADSLVDNPPAVDSLVDNLPAPTGDSLVDNAPGGGPYEEDYDWDEEGLAYGSDDADDADDYGYLDEYWAERHEPDSAMAIPGLAGALETFKGLAAELASVELALIVQPDKAWLRVGASPAPGGRLAAFAARLSTGDRALPYLRYCDADALVSMAWSTPYDWALPLIEELYGALLPDEPIVKAMSETIAAFGKASGADGALSLDLRPSDDLMATIESLPTSDPERAAASLARALGLRASGVMALTDRQGFRDALADSIALVEGEAYQTLLAESGLRLSARRRVGVIAGKPFDELSYGAGPVEGLGMVPPETLAASGFLSALGRFSYVYDGDRVFMGLGSPAEVASAIGVDGAKTRLDAGKAFRTLRAGASNDARALWYLSTANLVRLMQRLQPRGAQALGFHAGKLVGVLGWLDATPGSIGLGLGLGAEDIRAMAALAGAPGP